MSVAEGKPSSFAIHDAVRRFDLDRLKELIASGSDVNQIDQHRRAPVHIAAWLANYDALLLLIRSKALTNLKAMDGFTALHFACQSSGDIEKVDSCVRLLVKKDKSLLSQRVTKGNKSALHLAILKDKLQIVSTLIELGADLSAKTGSGQLPMALAKSENMRAVLKNGRFPKDEAKDEAADSEGEEETELQGNDDREKEEPDKQETAAVTGKKRSRETSDDDGEQ